jgi:hypothetical protein
MTTTASALAECVTNPSAAAVGPAAVPAGAELRKPGPTAAALTLLLVVQATWLALLAYGAYAIVAAF